MSTTTQDRPVVDPPRPRPEPAPALTDLEYHRLLVAVDGSAHGELALKAGVTMARRNHSALTLVSVAPDLVAETIRWPGAPVAPANLQEEADAAAQRTLVQALARIEDEIPVTTVFRRGKAGPEIIAVEQEGTYDAILVGARGVGRFAGVAGSVSQYVLHHAETVVFVAHAARGTECEFGSGAEA